MSSDESFVPKGEQAEVPYTDDAAAQREDERTAESEATGKVPASKYKQPLSLWTLLTIQARLRD